jgi:phage-related protein
MYVCIMNIDIGMWSVEIELRNTHAHMPLSQKLMSTESVDGQNKSFFTRNEYMSTCS